jgi:hypothetical protein
MARLNAKLRMSLSISRLERAVLSASLGEVARTGRRSPQAESVCVTEDEARARQDLLENFRLMDDLEADFYRSLSEVNAKLATRKG